MASLMDMYSMRYRPVEQDRREKIRGQVDGRDMIRQAVALNQKDPRYQALISGAEGGPFAVGSVGNVAKGAAKLLPWIKNTPFLRHSIPVAKVARGVGRGAKKAVWQPGTKPKVNTAGEIVTAGTRGRVRPGAVATGLTVAELGTLGILNKDEISGLLGGTPEEQVTTPEETVAPTAESVTYPELKSGKITPGERYTGVPMDDNSPHLKTIIDSPKRERKPLPIQKIPQNEPDETPEDTPSLWKTWGSLADDPKKRRDAYLGSIKNIYMKKMMLDSIANLTGGVSQGGSWAEMAIAELDAVEKFDSEQRLHNQWKALFFNENGDYNPPKNRKEAMERGQKLGYDSDQMKDIMSVFPKETDKRTNIEKYEEYISSLPEGSAKRIALEKKYLGMHEEEKDDRTSFEKFVERGVNSGLITKEQGDQSLKDKLVGTDSGLTAAQDNFNWYQSILAEGDEEKIAVANKFLNINGQKAATLGELLRLYTSEAFQDSDAFSPKEKSKLEELIKNAMGLGVSTVTTDSPSGITIKKKS